MLKMKTLFDVKEKKWKEQYDSSLVDSQVKITENDSLRMKLNECELKNAKLTEESKNLHIDLEDAQVKINTLDKQVEFYKKEVDSFLSAQKDSGKPMSVLDARLSAHTSNIIYFFIFYADWRDEDFAKLKLEIKSLQSELNALKNVKATPSDHDETFVFKYFCFI